MKPKKILIIIKFWKITRENFLDIIIVENEI